MDHMNWDVRIVVAGSRKFHDYALLKERLDHLTKDLATPPLIISGTASGADRLGERYAAERGLECLRMPADWNTYGKSAGYRRNQDMARHATHVVCFWDGNEHRSGTFHMMNIAREAQLPLRVVKFVSSASPAGWSA